MRLAAVGFVNDSGVGRELLSAVRQLPIQALYVLENPEKKTRVDLLPMSGYMLPKENSLSSMERWIEKVRPDTILTWEGPGNLEFPKLWSARGIRWVNVVHYDWFNPTYSDVWHYAELISPNEWCRKLLKDEHQLESTLLPVPIDTEQFAFRRRIKAESFVSVYGYGGAYDRRSLPEIFLSWSELSGAPPLLIHAQSKPPELETYMPPSQVDVRIGNLPEPQDLYGQGDVAIQVSRYEGIGVSFLEAMACGIPVVTTKAPPMNEIAPELTVDVEERKTVRLAGKEMTNSIPSISGLRDLVEYLRGRDIGELSDRVRWRMEKYYSWKALRSQWLKLLS